MKLLLYIFVILLPFQNTALRGTALAYMGSSIAIAPLMLLSFFAVLNGMHRKSVLSKTSLLTIGYVLFVSLVYLPFIPESHGESVFIKSLKLAILSFYAVFPIFFLRYSSARFLNSAILACLLIIYSGLLLTDIVQLSAFDSPSPLHFLPNANLRPRGFTIEASVLASQLIIVSLLCMHFYNQMWLRILFGVTLLAALAYTNSKGGVASLAISLVFVSMIYLKGGVIRKIAIVLISILACWFALESFVLPALQNDIEKYSSVATRTSLIISAFLSTFMNPLGMGFGGGLHALNIQIPSAVEVSDYIFGSQLNFSEVLSYVNARSDSDVTIKSFFFSFMVYFGIPFVFWFIALHYRVIKALILQRQLFLLTATIYSLIALISYSNLLGYYQFSLLYGIVWESATITRGHRARIHESNAVYAR